MTKSGTMTQLQARTNDVSNTHQQRTTTIYTTMTGATCDIEMKMSHILVKKPILKRGVEIRFLQLLKSKPKLNKPSNTFRTSADRRVVLVSSVYCPCLQ